MKSWKCRECHHEWVGEREKRCEWCGAEGMILTVSRPVPVLKLADLLTLDTKGAKPH